MDKITQKKQRVIVESAKLFYYHGYTNTGLLEILEVCKIPKGSFYCYFKNKEDLLIHIIRYHTDNLINFFDKTVNDLSIFKLKSFFFQYLNSIEANQFNGGSPLGNIAIELSDINENVRAELFNSYRKIEMKFTFFLAILKKSNPKYANIDSELYGRILITLLEGTMLKIKIEKAERPKEDFLAFFDKLFTILNEPN